MIINHTNSIYVNKKFIIPTYIAIKSLISSAYADTQYDIMVLYQGKIDCKVKCLYNLVSNTSHRIRIKDIREYPIKAPVTSKIWPSIVYVRLYLSSWLLEYDKVIFSDVDVLFVGDMTDVFNEDLQGYEWTRVAAGKNDEKMSTHTYYPENTHEYMYMGGFMIMNLKLMRELKWEKRCNSNIELYKDRLKMFDLEILNITANRIKNLPFRYVYLQSLYESNDITETSEFRWLSRIYSEEYLIEEKNNVKIIHYAGKVGLIGKPWLRFNPPDNYAKYMKILPPPPKKSEYISNCLGKYENADINFNSKDIKKVGIVVPAYNVEKYIGECLESLLSQTYYNIEICVVDDGSTDNTWNVILEYVSKDKRIKAYTGANNGFMSARDSAIKALKGCDYITFVDSDDYLCDTEIISKCVDEFNNNADMVSFNMSHGGRNVFHTQNRIEYSKFQALRDLLVHENMDGNLWGCIYRYSNVADNFRILECNNDDYINKNAFIEASDNIVILPDTGYFYRVNQESQTHRMMRNEDYIYYEHVNKFCGDVRRKYPSLNKECDYFEAWVLLWIVTGLNKNKECQRLDIYNKAMRKFREYNSRYLFGKYFNIKQRITYILVRLRLFRIMYQTYYKIKG